MFKRRVKLPTTLDEFDALVSRVVSRFNLTDTHHAAAIISIAIRHLPNDQAHTTLDYLGHTVLKNIANHIANHKSDVLKHGAQIDHLVSLIKADPTDQQARDELTKAASEGSERAQKAILEMANQEAQATVN